MYKSLKRVFDFVLSLAAAIFLSPLMLCVSLAVKLDSKGPVFFRQKRVGRDKSHFYMLKFRTMKTDAPKDMPTHLLKSPEAFITKTGAFLRKTSLDELPQLFNILKGDMSIVGPRPALWNQFDLIEQRDKYKANALRPGLTGLAQIKGRDELPIDVKAKYDGEYAEKMSLLFDIKCIWGTVKNVLSGEGVVEGGTGALKSGAEEKKMKLLFLANHEVTLYYFRTELIINLLGRGHEVYLSMPRDKHAKMFEQLGCRVIDTPITQYGMNPLAELKLVSLYKRMLDEIQPDAVVTFTIKPALYGGIACAAKGVPYISAITGLGGAFEKGRLFSFMIKMLYRFAARKISFLFLENAANSETFEQMKIACGKHVVVSGSGVNLVRHRFEKYPEQEGTKLLFVGRMMRDKGIFELCSAVRRARELYPSLSLDIIGWCESECEQLRASFDEGGAIRYLGWQEDIHSFVKNCHAVILPSYHEGMANALLEASSSGRPVLASNIPGCREAVEDGRTGLLFKPRDEESLYNAVVKFCEASREDREKMGCLAREKMEKEFDRVNVVNKYTEKIESLSSKN